MAFTRVNVTLDEQHAYRSLLASALDAADADPRNVTALLDGIDGAFERAERARQEIDGNGIPIEDL